MIFPSINPCNPANNAYLSPMKNSNTYAVTWKTYAIKTNKGYLATQDTEYWFEENPVGWALFTDKDYANAIGKRHHSAIGTKPGEGFSIEEIK